MNKAKKNQGYTLIELIVSISILTMITGLFLADYKSSNQKAMLNTAADQLASDIRLMQSYALGAKKTGSGTVPAGGWCINVFSPKDRYILFADNNGNGDYDGAGEKYKEIILPVQLEIKTGGFVISLPAGGTTSRNRIDVCYQPPDPKVSIVGTTGGGPRISTGIASAVIIRDKKIGQEKKLLFNSFGLIDVE
jgi:prepilin-type N-terminal cleavage/methylation domain-containing protein